MNVLQPYGNTLPTEVRYEIAKTVYQQHAQNVERTIQNAPAQSDSARKTERARAEFNLGLLGVDRMFRETALALIDPKACAHFVKDEVSKLAKETNNDDSPARFKEGVRKLVSRYPGVDFDLSILNSSQLKACLNVLQESRGGHLKKLNLDFSRSMLFRDEVETLLLPALKALAEHHPRIKTTLGLGYCDFGGATCDFGVLGTVAELKLESSKLDKKTTISIFRGMRNSSIEKLDLSNGTNSGWLDTESLQELALSLQSTRHLKTLDITSAFDHDFSDACACGLASTLGKTSIESLYVSGNGLNIGMNGTGGCVPIIENLPQNLNTLDLSKSGINGKLHLLASRLDQTRMSHLVLETCGIIGSELKANIPGEQVSVAHKLFNSSLQSISLGSNIGIGDSGAIAIAQALHITNVSELNLRNCGINDNGFRQLSLAIPGSNITTLDLANNPLGARGAAVLSVALKHPAAILKSVDLSGSQLHPLMYHHVVISSGDARRPIELTLPAQYFTEADIRHYQQSFPLLKLIFATEG